MRWRKVQCTSLGLGQLQDWGQACRARGNPNRRTRPARAQDGAMPDGDISLLHTLHHPPCSKKEEVG